MKLKSNRWPVKDTGQFQKNATIQILRFAAGLSNDERSLFLHWIKSLHQFESKKEKGLKMKNEYQNLATTTEVWEEMKVRRDRLWSGRQEEKYVPFAGEDTGGHIETLILPALREIVCHEFQITIEGSPMVQKDAEDIETSAREIKRMLCAYVDALATAYCQYGLSCFAPESDETNQELKKIGHRIP